MIRRALTGQLCLDENVLNPTYFNEGDLVRIYLDRHEHGGYAVRTGIVSKRCMKINGIDSSEPTSRKVGLEIKVQERGHISEMPTDLKHPESHPEPVIDEKANEKAFSPRTYPYWQIKYGEGLQPG